MARGGRPALSAVWWLALLAVWPARRECPGGWAPPVAARPRPLCLVGNWRPVCVAELAARLPAPARQQRRRRRRGTPRAADAGAVDAAAASRIFLNLALAAAIGNLVLGLFAKQRLYPPEECLPGRREPIPIAPPPHATHIWLAARPLYPPFPEDTETAMFGMGCFWCSENLFMRLPRGIYSTAVGYSGGVTPNPTYEEVCGGRTNHAEVVRVVYRPSEVSFEELLQRFWEGHDPTTENRQGNDVGTPYRSAIYCSTEEQLETANRTCDEFRQILQRRGISGQISTEIRLADEFYYAEGYHQQYDARGNSGYCGLRPTGASFTKVPAGVP